MDKDRGGVIPSIEKARCLRGISVAELARRIDVDRKRLWCVLKGRREMRVDEFLALCVALRIDPRAFITVKTVREIAARSLPDQGASAP